MPAWINKKTLLVSAFILLVILMGALLYFIILKPTFTPTISNTPNELANGELPISNASQGGANLNAVPLPGQFGASSTLTSEQQFRERTITELAAQITAKTNQPASYISLIGNKLFYYQASDGKFYYLDANGNNQTLSDQIFYQASNVTWSPQGNKAIIEYPDGSKIVYDFTNRKQTSLPKHWQDFSWSPNGDQIAAKSLGIDSENHFLIVSNPDGTGSKIISYLGANDSNINVSWSPNQQIVANYLKGIDYNRQEMYFIGLNKENYKSMIVEGYGVQSQWSTDGNSLLYSSYTSSNNYKPSLWIASAAPGTIGQTRKNLNIQTYASKCAFASNETLYCAVPTFMPNDGGLVPELTKNIPDQIQKIDLTSGTIATIATAGTTHTIKELTVSADGQNLYFTDQNTNGLFQINLK